MKIIMYIKSKNKKKFRQGEEYGSAVWRTASDIEPYMDSSGSGKTRFFVKPNLMQMLASLPNTATLIEKYIKET